MLKICDVIKYSSDEIIIEKGSISHCFFVVLKGSVEVRVGKSIASYKTEVKAGEIFGEAGLFSDVPRSADVVSVNISYVMQVERKKFLSYISQNATAGNKILMVMVYILFPRLKNVNQEILLENTALIDEEMDAFIKDYLE